MTLHRHDPLTTRRVIVGVARQLVACRDDTLSDPQRGHQPVIGFLAQAGAKDGAQIDVLAVGLAYVEELSPVYPTSQDELHRLADVVGSPFTFLADRWIGCLIPPGQHLGDSVGGDDEPCAQVGR